MDQAGIFFKEMLVRYLGRGLEPKRLNQQGAITMDERNLIFGTVLIIVVGN